MKSLFGYISSYPLAIYQFIMHQDSRPIKRQYLRLFKFPYLLIRELLKEQSPDQPTFSNFSVQFSLIFIKVYPWVDCIQCLVFLLHCRPSVGKGPVRSIPYLVVSYSVSHQFFSKTTLKILLIFLIKVVHHKISKLTQRFSQDETLKNTLLVL